MCFCYNLCFHYRIIKITHWYFLKFSLTHRYLALNRFQINHGYYHEIRFTIDSKIIIQSRQKLDMLELSLSVNFLSHQLSRPRNAWSIHKRNYKITVRTATFWCINTKFDVLENNPSQYPTRGQQVCSRFWTWSYFLTKL